MTNQNTSITPSSVAPTTLKELNTHTPRQSSVNATSAEVGPLQQSTAQSTDRIQELMKLREQLKLNQELPADRQGVDVQRAQEILELYQNTPGTTLFVTHDWQLLTKAEMDANPTTKVIGRCEIKVYKDKVDATKETLQFHRIEVDLTTYAQPAGGIQRYFLEYMLRWLDIKPSPYIYRFVNKQFSSTMATEFGKAKISFSVN
jgi:hypothetical protein